MAKDLKMIKEKNRLREWLAKLDAYAREQKLPTRILDSIEECQSQLKSGKQLWPDIQSQIEGILSSIQLKNQTDAMAIPPPHHNPGRIQEVESRIREIAKRCHRDNLSAITNLDKKKSLSLKECNRKMGEICSTRAHLDCLLDENLYLDFFEQIKNGYEKDSLQTAQELLGQAGGNCARMMDHMKSLFQDIGGRSDGIGNQKFYYEYESGRDNLERKLMGEAATSDFGSSAIMEFAQKTKNGIHNIGRKLRIKKIFYAWLPLLLMIAVFTGVAITHYPQTGMPAATEATAESPLSPLPDGKWTAKQLGGGVLVSLAYFAAGAVASLGAASLFLALLCIAFYGMYLSLLQAWFKGQICKRSEKYLKAELNRFFQDKTMEKKASEAIEDMIIQYEQQYLSVLNHILKGTPYSQETSKGAARFQALREEWNDFLKPAP